MPGVKTGLKTAMNTLGLGFDDGTTPYVFFVPNLGPLDRQQVLLMLRHLSSLIKFSQIETARVHVVFQIQMSDLIL